MKSICFLLIFFTFWTFNLAAQEKLTKPDLEITAKDVRVEAGELGWKVFIKQKPGLSSVMLTEAFEPEKHNLATYSYRSVDPNPVNDNEKRLLNGQFLKQTHRSLISSTPQDDAEFGKAFCILFPKLVEYGSKENPNSRYGQIDVLKELEKKDGKVWFSIRAFEKPYGDYSGAYKENAFELGTLVIQNIPAVTNDMTYSKDLEKDFARLGKTYKTSGVNDALDKVKNILQSRSKDTLDLVICVDTTKSMIENLETVKKNFIPKLKDVLAEYKMYRIGLVFYRDYMEEYLTRSVTFQTELAAVQAELDKSKAEGGGDEPEAVVEALYAALTQFNWQADNRLIMLVGDAPQHDTPRGKITEQDVVSSAKDKNIEIEMIMLPQTSK